LASTTAFSLVAAREDKNTYLRDFIKHHADNPIHFYTLADGIMISVRTLQRSEGDVSDPMKYIYS